MDGPALLTSRVIRLAYIYRPRGLESKQEVALDDLARVEQFADQLGLVAPELTTQPERWLESAVRSNITALDPNLRPIPVHSQVLSMAGRDRDSIDLLAVAYSG